MRDDLDRILSDQDEIEPSSGFVSSVMHAVRVEAAAPQPIPFPWVRAVPVFVAFLVLLVAIVIGIAEAVRIPVAAAAPWPKLSELEFVQHAIVQANAGWIAFAFLLTLFSTLFSFRLARIRP